MSHGIELLEKGEKLEQSLPEYGNYMMDLYHRSAYMKFTMNYYTYYEVLSEYDGIHQEAIHTFLQQLNELVKIAVVHSVNGEEREAAVRKVAALREQITDNVSVLSCYVDSFSRYEYVMNRIEYRFKTPEFLRDSEEELTRKLMRYIISDEDNSVINGKIAEIVGQLPVRMVKAKFYEYVREGLKVYSEATRQSFSDYLYTLRTAALLDTPKGFDTLFPELFEIWEDMKGQSFSHLEEEDYKKVSERLLYIASLTNQLIDIYMMLAELVNDLYVIILAHPYATEAPEVVNSRKACSNIYDLFEQGDFLTVDEETENLIVLLEGMPEKVGFDCARSEYLLDTVKSDYMEEVEQYMCRPLYEGLYICQKLMSGSLFVNLTEEITDEAMDTEYFETQVEKFITEISESFAGRDKMFNRAIMAAVLSSLPVFFNNMNEIKDYVFTALDQCRDEAEKNGCTEILLEMMEY